MENYNSDNLGYGRKRLKYGSDHETYSNAEVLNPSRSYGQLFLRKEVWFQRIECKLRAICFGNNLWTLFSRKMLPFIKMLSVFIHE
jgi:hypothetical protein